MTELRRYVASEHGARLDSDIDRGGGTDDTAALQAILDLARDGDGVHLVIDGVASVTGLDVHGNTTIEGTDGSGLHLADDSERAVLRNANRSRGEVVDAHIAIRNLVLNGNREGQREPYRGEQRPGENGLLPAGAVHIEQDHSFKGPVQFFGVRDLEFDRVTIRRPRTFSLWIANVTDVVIRDVVIDAEYGDYPEGGTWEEQVAFLEGPQRTNIDGIHINGPASRVLIERVRVTSEDDAISLCANDWFVPDLTQDDLSGPYVGQGPITDVTVRGAHIDRASHGIRLLSADQRVDRIVMEDVVGTVRERAVMISHFGIPAPTGDFGSISFRGLRLEALPSVSIGERVRARMPDFDVATSEEAESAFLAINSPIERLELRGVSVVTVDDRPLLRVGPDARIASLDADITVEGADGLPAVKILDGARLGDTNLTLRLGA